jgi:Flp pilus assembly pilin Flp
MGGLLKVITMIWGAQERFAKDVEGTVSIEYALLAGLIVAVLVPTVVLIGNIVSPLFESFAAMFPS